MRGPVAGGLVLAGHTGCGPGSVLAVYRGITDRQAVSCAAFAEAAGEGEIEAAVVEQIRRHV